MGLYGAQVRMTSFSFPASSGMPGPGERTMRSKAGYDPVVHCVRGREAAEAVAAEVKALGGSGEVLQFDVADREGAKAALEAWVEKGGAPYGVVLNAGIAADNAFPALGRPTAW